MLYNKKSGFTLIELIIVMGIISSMTFIINIKGSGFYKLSNKIDYEMCNNEIVSFINFSKQYCREADRLGNIYFSKSTNSLILYLNSESVKEYKLPKDFKIKFINAQNNRIHINSKGLISNACTFSYKDRKGETHELTICVGTGHVQVK